MVPQLQQWCHLRTETESIKIDQELIRKELKFVKLPSLAVIDDHLYSCDLSIAEIPIIILINSQTYLKQTQRSLIGSESKNVPTPTLCFVRNGRWIQCVFLEGVCFATCSEIFLVILSTFEKCSGTLYIVHSLKCIKHDQSFRYSCCQDRSIQSNKCFGITLWFEWQNCLWKETVITVKNVNEHDVKFSLWKFIKNNHFLFAWLSEKSQLPDMYFLQDCFLVPMMAKQMETLIADNGLSWSRVQSFVNVSTSKMIHLSCIFAVWKDKYG